MRNLITVPVQTPVVGRKAETENRASARLAFDLDAPPVKFDQFLGQSQADTRTAFGAAVRPEPLENTAEILRTDTRTVIAHLDPGIPVPVRPAGQHDPSARFGELVGVGEQAEKDVLDLVAVEGQRCGGNL